MTQAVTPIASGRTRLHHSMYSNMNRLFSKFVFYSTLYQVCKISDQLYEGLQRQNLLSPVCGPQSRAVKTSCSPLRDRKKPSETLESLRRRDPHSLIQRFSYHCTEPVHL